MATLDRQIDTIDSSDLLKPEIKLVQNTGGEKAKSDGAKPGDLYNTATGEVYTDGFEFVVLDIQKGRTYWGHDAIGDEPPICSSNNAKSYESVNGDNCWECPHRIDNPAQVDAKTRREKCCPNYTIQGIMIDTLTPFILRASGISSTPVASLLTRMVYNRAAHNPDNPSKIDWHRFKISVHGSEQKTPNGSAYALNFSAITPFGDDQFEQDMFRESAMLLGQADVLSALPECEQKERKQLPEQETITHTAKEESPKVNDVTPKQETKKTSTKKALALDI